MNQSKKDRSGGEMVKSTGIMRTVDELGRVVLPLETRRVFGIAEKDTLEILEDVEHHQIILQKTNRS